MSCDIISGISKGCRENAGGIVEVYMRAYPEGYVGNDWYTLDADEIVTAFDGLTASFYQFSPNKNSSNWVENIQSSVENGTIGYEQVLTLVFAKNDADKRNSIKILGQNNLITIVRDKNEVYWLLGAQSGLEVSGGNSSSGTLLNDLNGWNITVGGTEALPAYEVDATIIDALIA